MEAVYSWAKGSIYQIMGMTQVFEGSLNRAIRRLEEALQQLILASRSIRETELEAKLEAVSKIKRDRYSIRCIFVLVTYLDGHDFVKVHREIKPLLAMLFQVLLA